MVFFSPERAATAQDAAAAFTVLLLPYTLVGPFAGVLLDRWPRRQVLLWANLGRAAVVLAVAALVGTAAVGPALAVPVLVAVSVNRFFLAGLGASLPHVVPADQLVMANSVSPTAGTIATLAGGGAGYALRAALGAGDRTGATLLVGAAGGYLLSALLTTRMPRDLLGPRLDPARPSSWGQVRAVLEGFTGGARQLRARRPAGHALAAIGAHRFAYGLTTIATILLCRGYLTDPADVDAGLALLAAVFAASGVGILVAAGLTPLGVGRLGAFGWITACYAGAGVAAGLAGVALSVPLLLAGAFVLGVAAQGSKISVDSIVQTWVDDAFRGRVFALYDVIFNATFLLAAVTAAVAVPADGYSPSLFAGIAAIYLLTAALTQVASRRLGAGPAPG